MRSVRGSLGMLFSVPEASRGFTHTPVAATHPFPVSRFPFPCYLLQGGATPFMRA